MPEQGKNRPAKGKGSGRKPPPKEHRFKPGQSGNAKGRPPGSGFRAQVKAILDEPDAKKRGTLKEQLARKLVDMGLRGNVKAMELIDKQMAALEGDTPRDGPAIVFEIVERKADERKDK